MKHVDGFWTPGEVLDRYDNDLCKLALAAENSMLKRQVEELKTIKEMP